jgi:hypothetical protein
MPKKKSSKRRKRKSGAAVTPVKAWASMSSEEQVVEMVRLIKNDKLELPAGVPGYEINSARSKNLEPLMNRLGRHRPFLTGLLMEGLGDPAAIRYFVDAFLKAKVETARLAKAIPGTVEKKKRHLSTREVTLQAKIQTNIKNLVEQKDYGLAAFHVNRLGDVEGVKRLAGQCEREAAKTKDRVLLDQAIYIQERLLKDKEKTAALQRRLIAWPLKPVKKAAKKPAKKAAKKASKKKK